jgi:uncharacterized protein YlxW (UPF0749 family)
MVDRNLQTPSTKEDLEVAVAHIVSAIGKTLENYPTKEDLKNLATKEDLNRVEKKVNKLDQKVSEMDYKLNNVAADTSDIKRRLTDLEHDTPTQKEVDDLKRFVGFPQKS